MGPLLFGILSLLVGTIAGLGAVVFRGMIAFFHNLFFLGKLSVIYNANSHTPASPWGPLIILVPAAGALGVAFLVKNYAPEARGAGVPEVMDAVYYSGGRIRPRAAPLKALASALSIGSGAPVGREGPIIQIGSSLGSGIGQLLRLPAWQRITLVAAGAGGGIAATFNTPIGGILFAVEIILHEVSVRTLVPLTIASAAATYTGRVFFGSHPSFVIPTLATPYFHLTDPMVIPSYIILGLLVGWMSTLFIRAVYRFEDFFEQRVRGGYYVRHAAAMLVIGLIIYGLMVGFGHYYIEGVGYAAIQDVLTGHLAPTLLVFGLFGLKLLSAAMAIGSGASGGIFSPALFMGATLGGAYGLAIHPLFPTLAIDPLAFAVAGMAGMVAGTTGAALAAIVMIFEMTRDYNVIVPMTITVAIGHGIRRTLSRQSIYTLKLSRRGHTMPEALRADFHQLQRARDVMETRFVGVSGAASLDDLARIAAEKPDAAWFLVTAGDAVRGFVTKEAALTPLCQLREAVALSEVADDRYVVVAEDTTLFDVMDAMRLGRVAVALVCDNPAPLSVGSVKGLITQQQIGKTMALAVELYSDHRD